MKGIYLFCTKLRYYWVMLPIIFLFILCLFFNDETDGLLQLYPLMSVCILACVFIFTYYFRVIRISYDEIRYIGLYSSRDSAIINKDKTIILRMVKGSKIKIILFGNDGVVPDFSWMKSSSDAPNDISMFRGTACGGKSTVKRILKYFGVDKSEFDLILNSEFSKEYNNVLITSFYNEDNQEIHIKMLETI